MNCRPLVIFLFVCGFFLHHTHGQGEFHLRGPKSKQQLSFIHKNNLIIIPVKVNGKELNFILDTGVSRTILFSLNEIDSLGLKRVKKVKIRGLGSKDPVNALLSQNNKIQLQNIVSLHQNLLFILDSDFDLSAKLGLTIHGIIGYELLKDFVVSIDYSNKKITFYRHAEFRTRKIKNYEKLPLTFYNNKPYVHVNIKLKEQDDPLLVKLLIDSGGSEGLWLFKDSNPFIIAPEHYFHDYLGEGLSGVIMGKRAKIYSVFMGDYELKQPTVAYPDSSAIVIARKQLDRNGSVGGMILSRFKLVLDYKNETLYLKKARKFNAPFNYNMSGIELMYSGQVLVKETETSMLPEEGVSTSGVENIVVTINYNYKFVFKPSYRIFSVRENSPAYLAGLREDDIFLSVNNKAAHLFSLEEIVDLFYSKPNRKFKIKVNRNGYERSFKFKLKKLF
ncbi:MAG: hypothetical protein COB98_00355 [Flavobacteriaceae bacterium]|nr:MAG: hypothetical protein COB98_00355 [Flavobacteriaceae bacterium]